MTGRTHWTRKDVGRGCGYGDNILATVHNPAEGWYWREVTDERGFFNFDFRVQRGLLHVAPQMHAILRPKLPPHFVLVEPHIKGTFSADNKDWGFDRWQAVVDAVNLPWVQCCPPGKTPLRGVQAFRTDNFEMAVAVLSLSSGIATTNGGLQYAAGALGLPAVIVWGSFAPPEVLGYSFHGSLSTADPEGLGWRKSHPACREGMDRISVESVVGMVESTFNWPERLTFVLGQK